MGLNMRLHRFTPSPKESPTSASHETTSPVLRSSFRASLDLTAAVPSGAAKPVDDYLSQPFEWSASTSSCAQPQLSIPLLSLTDPDQPNALLMAPLIDIFFACFGDAFPFVWYECMVNAFLTSTLPPIHANCFAMLAVP
jgi:hypothetical protein